MTTITRYCLGMITAGAREMGLYRPWGPIEWVLPRCPVAHWSLFGCLGTEERSLGVWQYLSTSRRLSTVRLLRISDAPSRFAQMAADMEEQRVQQFTAGGGDPLRIQDHKLTESHFKIVSSIDSFIAEAGESIVLDVSSFPKRFFFPVLKRLIRKSNLVRNLIVTYTIPTGYTEGKLAENVDDWDHLPLFTGSYSPGRPEMFVIAVGFEAFGLQDRVEHGESGLPIKLLLPFPAPPAAFRRSWELVRKLQRHRPPEVFQLYRTDAGEVADAFDRVISLTNGGRRTAILAPFGPKPISVAICIFATLTESEVFYTQPTVYHPQYSVGIAMRNNVPAINAYCLRLDGQDYYALR